MGKNHALDQGYRRAQGEFLLFVDADTRAHPRLVQRTVAYCLRSGTGLLTLIHSCEFQCFWDSVVNSLILYLAPFQDIERFNDPADSRGNANGPFMLFRRDVYEKIGGHRAIAGEVVEDLVIARNVKAAGERLTWAIAPELFISRPYPSLADLRRGWGKVLFRCMELDPKLIRLNLVLPALLLLYLLFPIAVLACALVPGLLAWSLPVRFAMISLAAAPILSVVAGLRFVQILFRLHPALGDEERSPRLASFPPPPPDRLQWPSVSIVVPARNEVKHLAHCIESLRALDYPALEIVVVNDRSTDGTGELADRFAREDGRVKVVQGQDTPPGWTGKNYAIHQGTLEAGGEYLLIVDADSVISPGALKQAVHYAEQEEVDLLTLYPRVVCASFWERALLPWLGVLSTFRMDRVNDPASPDAMAYGYFLFFRRASFDKVGGHKAIRDRVGEDWIIARRLKSMGLRLRMLMGTEYVTKRFGPTLAEIWQGFTKNFILIMEGNKWVAALALPLMVYYLALTLVPWPVLGTAPVVLVTGGWSSFWALALLLAALQICMLGAVRALLRLFIRVEVAAPYLQPLGGLVVAAMGLTAIHRTLSGRGIVWKGRQYKEF